MNFEQLLKKKPFKFKTTQLNKKISKSIDLKTSNKEKLKLGALVFEIKEIKFGEFTLTETVDIRFTKQDNTFEDSLKIDTRLDALKWKWDFSNVLAFTLILFIISFIFYINCYNWYYENLYFLFNDFEKNKYLNNSFKLIFASTPYFLKHLTIANNSINTLLIELFDSFIAN